MADSTVHRIWDFRGDQAGIVWFRKHADGSVQVLRGYVNSGKPLHYYAGGVRGLGADPSSIDYVRPDAHAKDMRGISLFEAMKALGLNPEVLPAAAWKTPQPFAEAA